jgi:F-BAR domain only protein
LAGHVPLILKPAWKPTGDKLGLLLQYRLNPETSLARPVTLTNVVFVATYDSPTPAAGAQTKPSGTHLKDKKLVYWRLGDVTLTEEWGKIVCRIVGSENGELKPGSVEARWEYVVPNDEENGAGGGITVSRWVESKGKGKGPAEEEDDPFADEDAAGGKESAEGSWVDVPQVKKLVSGKYEAN